MPFDIGKYVKRSAKDALTRMSDDAARSVTRAAGDIVGGAINKGLSAIGVGKVLREDIAGKIADSVSAEGQKAWYGRGEPRLERVTGEGIRNNRAPSTGSGFGDPISQDKLGKNLKQGDAALARGNTAIISYPSNMGRYHTALEFRSYERPAPHLQASDKIEKIIFLPIPRNLVESHTMDYESGKQGATGGVADALQRGDDPSTSLGVVAGDAIIRNLQKVNGAGETAANFIQQAYGFAVNPHLSVMFRGGTLRTHTFRWTFAPETQAESRTLKEIINNLRLFSLPTFFNGTSAIFDYPKMCKVRFHPWSDNNMDNRDNQNDLYTIKQCMVKEIIVNYAPNGIPSFFKGTNLPTFIELELQLQEIEYFTANDYGGSSSKSPEDIVDGVDRFVSALVTGEGGEEPTPTNTESLTNDNGNTKSQPVPGR